MCSGQETRRFRHIDKGIFFCGKSYRGGGGGAAMQEEEQQGNGGQIQIFIDPSSLIHMPSTYGKSGRPFPMSCRDKKRSVCPKEEEEVFYGKVKLARKLDHATDCRPKRPRPLSTLDLADQVCV